jgi:hypothetical protein
MSNKKPIDVESDYDNYLDSCYPEVSVADLKYTTSMVLKQIDPTAYRCGLCDYIDSQCKDRIWVEINDKYYDYDDFQLLKDELEAS